MGVSPTLVVQIAWYLLMQSIGLGKHTRIILCTYLLLPFMVMENSGGLLTAQGIILKTYLNPQFLGLISQFSPRYAYTEWHMVLALCRTNKLIGKGYSRKDKICP